MLKRLDCDGARFWVLIGALSLTSLASTALLVWIVATGA
jgi:hypothetical protein